MAAYAREVGLNPNTARKFMKGEPAPLLVTSDPKQAAKSDPKSDPKPRKTSSDPAKSDPDTHQNNNSQDREKRSGKSAGKAKKEIKSGRYKKPAPAGGEGGSHASDPGCASIVEGRNGSAWFEPLTAQDHTGGFISYMNMDQETLDASLSLSMSDGDLLLASGRYLLLLRSKDAARKRVIADYEDEKPWCYPGTETEMPLEMAIMQAETAPAQRLAELERFMGTRKATLWRQRWAEQEKRETLEREGQTTKILQERLAHGWSALETAQRLEALGLDLPRSLELEVAREVGFIEPITDTDGGISDAELEEQSRAYMANQKEVMGDWLPRRREEVANALAAELAHQAGDMLSEAEFDQVEEDHGDLPLGVDWGEHDEEPLTPVAEVWR